METSVPVLFQCFLLPFAYYRTRTGCINPCVLKIKNQYGNKFPLERRQIVYAFWLAARSPATTRPTLYNSWYGYGGNQMNGMVIRKSFRHPQYWPTSTTSTHPQVYNQTNSIEMKTPRKKFKFSNRGRQFPYADGRWLIEKKEWIYIQKRPVRGVVDSGPWLETVARGVRQRDNNRTPKVKRGKAAIGL